MAAQIENFVKYPPRQKAASFNLDSVMASLGASTGRVQGQRSEGGRLKLEAELVRKPALSLSEQQSVEREVEKASLSILFYDGS